MSKGKPPLYGSAKEGFNSLPPYRQEEIRKKAHLLRTIQLDKLGPGIRNWRKTEPKHGQAVMARALGLSQTLVSKVELGTVSPILVERFVAFRDLLTEEPETYVCPESGKTPEEELAAWCSDFRAIINKYRPLLGKEALNQQFIDLLTKTDSAMAELHNEAVRLGRAAHDRRRSTSV